MAIAIFGGTFDPFHDAHERIVRTVASLHYIDKVFVMPAGNPPHKPNQWISFASYRLAMVEAAVKNINKTSVARYELQKRGRSYTVETIRHFKEKHKEDVYIVIGADSFLEIEEWYKYKEILSLAKILVARRPGHKGLKKHKKYLKDKYKAKVRFIDIEESSISSSLLRRELENGDFSNPELNDRVKRLIENNKLYEKRNLEDIFTAKQIDQLQDYERVMLPHLSTYRAMHAVNTMYQAIYVAEKIGYDLWEAAVAGLLHDCAKEMNPKNYPDFLDWVDKSYIESEDLTHGPLGAYLLQPMFAIANPRIYDAIYYHTTLREDFSQLEGILYLADKSEPSRTFSGVEKIRAKIEQDPKKALKKAIKNNNAKLEKRGKKVHPFTIDALQAFK